MKKITMLLTILIIGLVFTGCTGDTQKDVSNRDNNTYEIPKLDDDFTILSTMASNTEILVGLGLADNIIGIDKYSPMDNLKEDVTKFDMFNFDAETAISLMPDVVMATVTNNVSGSDTFAPLKSVGIKVYYVSEADTIEHIYENIEFIGDLLGKSKNADKIVDDMKAEIKVVSDIAENITEKKSVYFEIGESNGTLYTVGSGTYLNEMIELVGGNNVYSNMSGWRKASAEDVIAKNPQIIITNANPTWYPNIVSDIKGRKGFGTTDAVKNNDVYVVDTNSTSRSTQHIIKAIKEIAVTLYPDLYDFS